MELHVHQSGENAIVTSTGPLSLQSKKIRSCTLFFAKVHPLCIDLIPPSRVDTLTCAKDSSIRRFCTDSVVLWPHHSTQIMITAL